MKGIFKHIILVFLCMLSFLGKAQVINDAGLWTTLNFEKKLNKKFAILLTEEFRMRENITRLNLFYTDLGISYKPAEFFKASISYRWIDKYQVEGYFSFRHRFSLDLLFKKKIENFIVSYRHRLQREVRDINSTYDGRLPEWYSRSKVEVKYDIGKRLTPYVSFEARYQINNPRMQESDNTWHRSRYALGFNYEMNKRNTLGAYYLIQNEYNVSSPQNQYIIGLEYSLSL